MVMPGRKPTPPRRGRRRLRRRLLPLPRSKGTRPPTTASPRRPPPARSRVRFASRADALKAGRGRKYGPDRKVGRGRKGGPVPTGAGDGCLARSGDGSGRSVATAPTATGLLDVLPEGYGFLRTSGYLPGSEDIYVSLSQVRRFMLRKGDVVTGKVRQPKDSEKYFALLQIESVNGVDPETAKQRAVFEKLTPLFPHERFRLESSPTDVTARIIDMVAPIGKGQRGMVVSPPKAGKTTVLKNIANGILTSNPETHVIVLLVDERPEEVTDW